MMFLNDIYYTIEKYGKYVPYMLLSLFLKPKRPSVGCRVACERRRISGSKYVCVRRLKIGRKIRIFSLGMKNIHSDNNKKKSVYEIARPRGQFVLLTTQRKRLLARKDVHACFRFNEDTFFAGIDGCQDDRFLVEPGLC